MFYRRARLGTTPPISDERDEVPARELGFSVSLDRPFHEIKETLLAEFERAYLTRCLALSAMNLSQASRTSGLSRKHLRTLISKHEIRRDLGPDLGADDDDDDTDEVDTVAEPANLRACPAPEAVAG
jgi:hypothetical protein